MQEITKRSDCRLCLGKKLTPVLELEPTPIGDEYVAKAQLDVEQTSYPLTVYQCGTCGHAQLLDIVAPEILFRNYTFSTASSPGLLAHFQRYVDHVLQRFDVQIPGLVVEIGSNDGSLLGFFKEKGFDVMGVDPAIQIADQATARGLPTLAQFFTQATAAEISGQKGKAQFICANNVYAHADDLREITKGVKKLLDTDGVFIFEVSYLRDILDKMLFDTIYHEHLCYHSVTPLVRFFHSLDLELFDAEHIPTKGGSIRCYVQHKGGPRKQADVVDKLIQLEAQKEIHTPRPFKELSTHLSKAVAELHAALDSYKDAGKKIAGFGASVTATTLLYHFKLKRYLTIIFDDNESKTGLYSPGAHIPIAGSKYMYDARSKPDVVVILVWQYADAIMKKHADFAASGGVFAVPLPTLKVTG